MQDAVRDAVLGAFEEARVRVDMEGNHCAIAVVAAEFEGLSRVRRQQAVYAAIREFIESGAIHAVTIRAQTPDEAAASDEGGA